MNDVRPGALLVARYRFVEPLPSDLVDVVAWSAHDQILDRAVRVSLLRGDHVSEALDSSRRAALVTDSRLTRVLDVGVEGDLAYVITEPVAGITLCEVVAGGIVDAQQARAIIGEAASALEVAQRRGVHHLTLRPEAIRIDGSRVVVTGLGLDAGISGQDHSDADASSRIDTAGLVSLLYYAMTARWPGSSLDVPWISPDTVNPLPAQHDGAGILPLTAIVPHAPEDLSALCARTFGARNGGAEAPHSPAELVAALAPWGQVSVVAALPSFVQPTAAPGAPVSRQSVRSAFGTPATAPPGTPPPAPPVRRPSTGRIHRVPEAVAAAGGAQLAAGQQAAGYPAAAGQTAAPVMFTQSGMPPTAPPPAPGQPGADFASIVPPSGPRKPPAPRKGFNPTGLVLGIFALAVILGVVWAMRNVLDGFDAPSSAGGPETSVSTPTGDATTDPAEPSATPTPTPTPEVRPQITAGHQLDPEGGDAAGEHPEAEGLAYDGQPETFWFTRTFKTPNFGGLKSGVGYAIELKEAAPVTKILLDTNNTGGHVEVRATSPDKPTEGEVLASGALAPQTELTFPTPTTGQSFVLWFTELPKAPDGSNRVELNEILIS